MRDNLLKNYELKKKFFFFLFVAILFIVVFMSIFSYKLVDSQFEDKINSTLKSAALNTALVLGEDFFDRAVKKDAISKEEDIANTLKLNKLASNEGVRYVYSMVERNGKIYFTSSSAQPGETLENYWMYYPEATKQLKNIFKIGHAFYEVSTDRWGTFKSILIPMHTKKGTPYIVGADIQIDAIIQAKKEFLKDIVLMDIAILLVLLFFAYKVRKILRKELDVISGIEKELKKEIDAKTKELQELNAHLRQRVEEEVEKNRRKDKELILASRFAEMGEAISLIIHQLKQPINAIFLSVSYLEIEKDEKSIDFCASNVKLSVNQLQETIEVFRNFFKQDKEKEEVEINSIIEDVLKIEEIIFKDKNIELQTKLNSKERVKVFKNEIKQVLIDLIKNAIDEFEKRGVKNPKIEIITEGKKIIVRDNAGGIPEDIKDKIFDQYFTTKEKGTGLGLYMSKVIIEERNGGKISVKNHEDGAEFIIEFKE